MALSWLLLLLLWVGVVHAQTQMNPTQGVNSKNQEATSGINSAVSITLSPSPATRAKLNSVSAFCSGGSALITISDGGVERYRSDPTGTIGTISKSLTWIPPFTGGIGNPLVITLSPCGAGNVGTMTVQGEVS